MCSEALIGISLILYDISISITDFTILSSSALGLSTITCKVHFSKVPMYLPRNPNGIALNSQARNTSYTLTYEFSLYSTAGFNY